MNVYDLNKKKSFIQLCMAYLLLIFNTQFL